MNGSDPEWKAYIVRRTSSNNSTALTASQCFFSCLRNVQKSRSVCPGAIPAILSRVGYRQDNIRLKTRIAPGKSIRKKTQPIVTSTNVTAAPPHAAARDW